MTSPLEGFSCFSCFNLWLYMLTHCHSNMLTHRHSNMICPHSFAWFSLFSCQILCVWCEFPRYQLWQLTQFCQLESPDKWVDTSEILLYIPSKRITARIRKSKKKERNESLFHFNFWLGRDDFFSASNAQMSSVRSLWLLSRLLFISLVGGQASLFGYNYFFVSFLWLLTGFLVSACFLRNSWFQSFMVNGSHFWNHCMSRKEK